MKTERRKISTLLKNASVWLWDGVQLDLTQPDEQICPGFLNACKDSGMSFKTFRPLNKRVRAVIGIADGEYDIFDSAVAREHTVNCYGVAERQMFRYMLVLNMIEYYKTIGD